MTAPLIVGVLHHYGNGPKLRIHAYVLGKPERCGKCRSCLFWPYGGKDCERPGNVEDVHRLCSESGAEPLAKFIDDLFKIGPKPITSVDCQQCKRAMARHGITV